MTIGEADKRPLTGQEVHDEGLDGWRLVFDDSAAPEHWVLADPDGN